MPLGCVSAWILGIYKPLKIYNLWTMYLQIDSHNAQWPKEKEMKQYTIDNLHVSYNNEDVTEFIMWQKILMMKMTGK